MPNATQPAPRLASLDALRGLAMLFMATGGLGFAAIAAEHPDSAFWSFLKDHTTHAAWLGGGAWDLIQPAFMLMVGVAIPYSLASRRRAGESYGRSLLHAIGRAALLVALAILGGIVPGPLLEASRPAAEAWVARVTAFEGSPERNYAGLPPRPGQ